MDIGAIEKLIAEQFRSKDTLIEPNVHALHLGRDYVMMNLDHPIGLRLKKANAIGDRILLEGNSAVALGAVYGGATVCAWYPITPSSSVARRSSATARATAPTATRRTASPSSRPRTSLPRSAW
jgi:2-oxoglutarate ferredoxin oxidoreductase subunit alpha